MGLKVETPEKGGWLKRPNMAAVAIPGTQPGGKQRNRKVGGMPRVNKQKARAP